MYCLGVIPRGRGQCPAGIRPRGRGWLPAVEHKTYSGCMNSSAHVVPWLTIICFFAGDLHYKPSATDSAATPGSQEMSQDESGTRAKHLLLQLQAQRARWLSSAAAGVPAMKKFTSSLHFVCYKFAP